MSNETKECAVCKSRDKVEFLTITDCLLCEKCEKDLSDSFESAMTTGRTESKDF